jgi:hypothetical protein
VFSEPPSVLEDSDLEDSERFEPDLPRLDPAVVFSPASEGAADSGLFAGSATSVALVERRRVAGFGSAACADSTFGAAVVLVSLTVSFESEELVARLTRFTGLSCWISSMFLIAHFYAALWAVYKEFRDKCSGAFSCLIHAAVQH